MTQFRTESAPHDDQNSSSRGVACERHETMEEVSTPLASTSTSEGHGPVGTAEDPKDGVSAPLSAPPHQILARGKDLAEMHVVYGLVDPDEPGRVRYVGKSNNPHGRLLAHVTGRGGGQAVGSWVARLRRLGRFPDMVLLEAVAPGARSRELYWYERLRGIGQADLNTLAPQAHCDFRRDRRRGLRRAS